MNGDLQQRIQQVRERLARLPRKALAHLPTPLDRCTHLARALNMEGLYIKRDDCTGLAFGGNKTRQLEYILGDAVAKGHDCIIQGAASQSNHARQLAAAGAKLGLKVYLTPRQDARSRPIQGNYLVSHLLGPEIRPVDPGAVMKDTKERLAQELREQGKNPYIVGMGAFESLVLSAVAYVGAALEIVEQLAALGEGPPHWIYTTSQGGTQAGLLLGCRLLGLSTRVVGINPMDAREEAYVPPEQIARMVNGAAEKLGYSLRVEEGEIENTTDYVGPGYAIPSEAGLEAMRLLATHEGILLDPVYSAKGFAGFVDHIRQGRIGRGERAVFVHTGGTPAIFAYASELAEALKTP